MISWNRYYDPETGRYLSPDPIGVLPNGPLYGLNHLYAYAGGDPINNIDIEGLLISCGKCLYYAREIAKSKKKCMDELSPNSTSEEILEYCKKYDNASWLEEAVINCVKQKSPDIYKKWLTSCFQCGWGGGPKPKPTR